MIYKSIVITFLVFIVGCTSTFKRLGYTGAPENYTFDKSCKVAIKSNAALPPNAKIVGTVEASEPGAGTNCQEAFVLSTFTKDACYLRANVVNIIEETNPNFWSSCYRAKAQIVRAEPMKTDEKYSPEKICERSNRGDAQTRGMIFGMGGVIGFAAGESTATIRECK